MDLQRGGENITCQNDSATPSSVNLTGIFIHTSLSSWSQHIASGAVVIGGNNPHAEKLATRYTGNFTAIVWGGAFVQFPVVPHGFHVVEKSSCRRLPGCDEFSSVTVSSCPDVCWLTGSCKKKTNILFLKLLSIK